MGCITDREADAKAGSKKVNEVTPKKSRETNRDQTDRPWTKLSQEDDQNEEKICIIRKDESDNSDKDEARDEDKHDDTEKNDQQ